MTARYSSLPGQVEVPAPNFFESVAEVVGMLEVSSERCMGVEMR